MWNIIWVLQQGHRSVSVSRHFLLQAPQCPCSMRKRFSKDHCCPGRSKPSCRIVGSHTWWELTTWADFQLCLHRLLMSTGCKYSQSGLYYKASSMIEPCEKYAACRALYYAQRKYRETKSSNLWITVVKTVKQSKWYLATNKLQKKFT